MSDRHAIRRTKPLPLSEDAITILDDLRSALLAIGSLADHVELNHERTRSVWFLNNLALDMLSSFENSLPQA